MTAAARRTMNPSSKRGMMIKERILPDKRCGQLQVKSPPGISIIDVPGGDTGGILMNSTMSGGFAPDRYAEPQQVDYSRISPNSDDFTVNQKCSPFFALYNSAEHFGTTGLSDISSVRHIPSSS